MIKFEEHDNQLFRMLEEPVPLQLDSQMPCVVRYIQDCSPMGRYMKRKYAMVINTVAIVSRIGTNWRAYSSDEIFAEEVEVLEIIGYPVAEGSKDWALYQMMQGKKVRHKDAIGNVYWALNQDGDVQYYDIDDLAYIGTIRGKLEFGERKLGNYIWQLYEEPEHPKPLLADAKVGDLVKLETGKWHKIKAIVQQHESCLDFLVYGLDDGIHYAPNGNGMRTDSLRIVEWQPLAPEGSAEWAWQMLNLLRLPVYHPAEGVLRIPIGLGVKEFVRSYAKIGWQLYKESEPEPAKEQFEVGDWVEYRGNFGIHIGRIDAVSPGGSKVHIYVSDALGLGVDISCLRKLSHSEVVVPITISGTVRPAYNEDGTIDDEQFQLLPNASWDGTEMFISFDALDTHTRELVESLLEAREEEK